MSAACGTAAGAAGEAGLAGAPPARVDAASFIEGIYGAVYDLALRMLLVPEDAEDATQEICIAILRALPGFRGEASLKTWALAIAAKRLLSFRSRRLPGLSFEAYEAEVGAHADPRFAAPEGVGLTEGERALLEGELKISCTLGMLQCLDATDRLVYVLHCFFRLGSREAGEIAGLSAEAYRQRLSRSRERMAAFLREVCGLSGGGACSCAARLDYALARGRVGRERPYAKAADRAAGEIARFIEGMEELDAAAAIFRAMPPMLPGQARERVERILERSSRAVLEP